MNCTRFAFACIFFCIPVYAASLLKPQSFPQTADDLSFTQRIELAQEGYEPYKSLYDKETGRCISGCLYPGITIQEEMKIIQENTNAAAQNLVPYVQNNQMQLTPAQIQQIINILGNNHNQTTQAEIDAFNNQIAELYQSYMQSMQQNQEQQQPEPPRCSPHHPDIPANQTLPFGEPLTGKPRISSGYGARPDPFTGEPSGHRGMDFSVPVETNVYTPASGTVKSVWTDGSCGNGLKISHADGYETIYCHLSYATVKTGDHVDAGCVVAKSGNTGNSTGPHLHYGIKHNNDYIDPTDWVGRD